MPITLKFSEKLREKKALQNWFYKASIIVIWKTDKDKTRK